MLHGTENNPQRKVRNNATLYLETRTPSYLYHAKWRTLLLPRQVSQNAVKFREMRLKSHLLLTGDWGDKEIEFRPLTLRSTPQTGLEGVHLVYNIPTYYAAIYENTKGVLEVIYV